jgi:hypothetical protein
MFVFKARVLARRRNASQDAREGTAAFVEERAQRFGGS